MWSSSTGCGLISSRTHPRFHALTLSSPNPAARRFARIRLPEPPSARFGSFGIRAAATMAPEAVADMGSFYNILGVPESGSLSDIKHAYRQLALRYHPDVSPAGLVDESTRMFIRVQEAYDTLSDPNRRAAYDRDLRLGFSGGNRRRCGNVERNGGWRSRWQTQLCELKRRTKHKGGGEGKVSWQARLRRRRFESSYEL